MKTVIIDCGGGNLQSVKNALDFLGFANEISSDLNQIQRADRVIFPGQGHFGTVMQQLVQKKLLPALLLSAKTKPFLGICVGMQLLLNSSEEAPGVAGLGLIEGTVKKLPASEKIPLMGWNEVEFQGQTGSYYFAHSYYCDVEDQSCVAATTTYGLTYPCILQRDRLCAVQFHPEKSGEMGLQFLESFVRQQW